ncbi:MAG: RsmB/NOP family class I SAM-dependent RNA methyltransferase [Sulfolobales archaeon]|nr:RsmB/NOP family class I SAM-dependent RNA methyltransferase [Ignisphaera sp.]MCX8199718.1 RsmB/NOP family class I SAM-dependent RNA methyltransferase [Sulfolobales archaeon]MDW8085863.1 RsmB/NOP family class I SAM-dependent RNA methyltransferase [Ignisphaera sp.]
MLSYDAGVLSAIERVYGYEYSVFLDAISRPSSRMYARVNTLRISVEEVVDRLRARGLAVFLDEELDEAIYFFVEGPFAIELQDYDKIVVADKYAAESVYLGSNLYAPGVIRCSNSVRVGDEVTVVTVDGRPIAKGVSMINCRDVRSVRRGIAVEVLKSIYRAPKIIELPEYRAGLIYPQSLAAMYTVRALDPKPGSVVVDTCAAPGGKTGHIVEYTLGKALVFAFDHSRRRLNEMRGVLDRLGHTPLVELWRADSRYLHTDFSWIGADRIIVDPPCTSLGVRPKLYDTKNYSDIVSASRYQIQFLKSASKILKVGGIMVYSTCTITIEENEEVIEQLIGEDRCLKVVDTEIRRGSRGVATPHSHAFTRFHPHVHDTTGYFIAKIAKVC